MVYYKLRFFKVMILYFIFYFVLDITKTNMNIRTNRTKVSQVNKYQLASL